MESLQFYFKCDGYEGIEPFGYTTELTQQLPKAVRTVNNDAVKVVLEIPEVVSVLSLFVACDPNITIEEYAKTFLALLNPLDMEVEDEEPSEPAKLFKLINTTNNSRDMWYGITKVQELMFGVDWMKRLKEIAEDYSFEIHPVLNQTCLVLTNLLKGKGEAYITPEVFSSMAYISKEKAEKDFEQKVEEANK